NYHKPERPVVSKEGKVITNTEEQQNRCVEHFKELLNRPAPLYPPNIKATPTDLPINVGSPTFEEIGMGPDNVPTDALKTDVALTEKILHTLFSKIWDEEQVGTDWRKRTPDQDGKEKRSQMNDSVDAQLRDQQAGFRKDQLCTDGIATLRITVKQSIKCNSSLHINSIDYKKAFDSMEGTTLWWPLRHYGVFEKIVNTIRDSYNALNCKIVYGGHLTDSFNVKTGVRQGCLLSSGAGNQEEELEMDRTHIVECT
ncbi:unnamed protein product, partial [Schistosoma curassoni]|uniref:Reverse transcriptase domain-containing protein n=1 Tax=Schistosoma curassoni TaxID=6186 RepID=A0A183L3H9_9TREM